MSSDPDTYSHIENGQYLGKYEDMATSIYGTSGAKKRGIPTALTYRITNLDGTTQIRPESGINKINGKNYMEGIYFHRTDWGGKATKSSQGCLNIDGRQWKKVEEQLGKIDLFQIIIKRSKN